MPDIKITFEEVRTKTKQIRNYNATLTDTLRAKITGMQPKFDTYKEVIESYAKFLDNTVAQYEGTESTLNSNASSQFI